MSRDRARNVRTRDLLHDLSRAGFEAGDSGRGDHAKWIGPHGVERVAVARGGPKDADAALVKQVRRAVARAEYRTAGLTSGLTKGTKLLAYFVEVFEAPLLSARSYADRLGETVRTSAGGLLNSLANKGLIDRVETEKGIRWAPPGMDVRLAGLVQVAATPPPSTVQLLSALAPGLQEAPQEVEEVETPPSPQEEGGAPLPPREAGVDPLGDLLARLDVWRLDHGTAAGDVVEALALLEDSQSRVRDLADQIEKGEEVARRYADALQAVRDLSEI